MYPRHVEEFEDVREMTLSVSCPEVARILLGKKEPVRFLTYESNKEEEYDDFDPFLYSKLVDARKVMINILQDRSKRLDLRVGLVLAIAHDLQVRIKREDIFSIDDVFEKNIRRRRRRNSLKQNYQKMKTMHLLRKCSRINI